MSTTVQRSESVDNTCPVCHDVIEIFAIGQCDHPVCSRCSTRMRVLCEQMVCPICRSQMPQVAFVYKRSLFRNINLRDCIPNRKYKIFFENKDVEDSFLELLEYRCRVPSCQNRNPEKSFAQLQTHMRRDHLLFACDLCVSHLKIFPFERKFYSRKDLATHRRVGDLDDKSYKGHPLCEFCDERYNDTDELLKHVRKDHFFCHFCDQHGCNAYYDQYPDLMKHFEESHLLCKEGECGNPSTRFTHAFTSEIDLKAHRASAHNKNLSKAQSREARTIEVDFHSSRRRPGPNRGEDLEDNRPQRGRVGDRHNRRRDYDPEEADLYRAIEASKGTGQTETVPAFAEFVPDPVADFPALNGAVVPVSVPATAPKQVRTHEDDFPSLSAARGNKQQSQPQVKAYSTIMNRQIDTKPTVPIVKESKPVSLGTVSKVIRDHPSYVPRNTEDEYPTLGGNSPSLQSLVSNNSSGNWVKKSQNKNIVGNSGTSVSKTKKQSTEKPKTSHPVDTFVKDEKQFPTLASAGEPKSLLSQSGPDYTKQNGSSKKKQRAEKNYDQSFELPESYRSFEDSTSYVKTDGDVSNFFTSVNKSKVASINSQDEFPGLPVRAEKVKIKDGIKKKKTAKKESNVKAKVSENTNVCLGEIALSLMPPEKNINHNKDKIVSNKSPSNNNKLSKMLDWFDNPDDFQPKVSQYNENVILAKKDICSLEDSSDSNTFPNDDSSNFPSLHTMSISIQQPKPPPGFTSYPQHSNITSVSAPPGFGKQPSSLSAIPSTPPGFSLNPVYIQPEDFKTRNLKLIEDIRKSLVNIDEGFSNFKVLSSQFRQGLMDASTYYMSCQALMGDVEFTSVFPELLALLPDISKQQELWEVHKAATGNLAAISIDKLSDCQVCGQVMVARDVCHHQQQHGSKRDLFLFNDVHNSKVMSSNGVGSDVKMESWIKAK